MQVILIGNYPPDKQESMERFAQMLSKGFNRAGVDTEIWRPVAVFGSVINTTQGIGKWIGYIDKWILFPMILLWRLRRQRLRKSFARYHVCDHSNAPYLKYLPKDRTVITCHDALAIRGAFGFSDAYCPASPAGVILQKWILRRLQQAGTLIVTSLLTYDHLMQLSSDRKISPDNWHIIPLAFNADFKKIEEKERDKLISQAGLQPGLPFLLHVGSALPRKNRKMLIDMVTIMGNNWDGKICFAGEAVESDLLAYAESKGLRERIVSVVKPGHEILVALYNACEAFIFPSFSEGFGWPVIEAQACGALVIASDLPPMPEVSGGAALHANPNKAEEFANAFNMLRNDQSLRAELVRKGFENVKRFNLDKMTNAYLSLHGYVKEKECC